MDKKEAFAAELAKVRAFYRERLPGEIAELEKVTARLQQMGPDRALLDDLLHRLHRFAGSGGVFGLSAISSKARALEKELRTWLHREDDDGIGGDELAGFLARIGEISEIFAAAEHSDEPHQAVVGVRDTHPPLINTNAATIWLVEDDPILGKELCSLLEQYGYHTVLFDRMEKVERAAGSEAPDALVMDVVFAEEGVKATDVVQTSPVFQSLACPVFFMTSYDDFAYQAQAARFGAAGYFLKPLDVLSLVERLEWILDGRKQASYRILIVEDDGLLAEHFRALLMGAGMEVEVLQQPEHILERVREFRPELILMDMHLPGYTGAELATVIPFHSEWTSLPIVYLSANTDKHVQNQAMERGADDFLVKPISDAQLLAVVNTRAARARELSELVAKDSLTGLLKHSRIKEELRMELSRASRSGAACAVAMVDIDRFKTVNDTYGHAVGDRVIKALAHLLKQRVRKTDLVGRYGGEEFALVLSHCNSTQARAILEDIRIRFSTLRFYSGEQEFTCALSAGIAVSDVFPDQVGDLLLVAADEALYLAKRAGRNQVCVAGEPTGVGI